MEGINESLVEESLQKDKMISFPFLNEINLSYGDITDYHGYDWTVRKSHEMLPDEPKMGCCALWIHVTHQARHITPYFGDVPIDDVSLSPNLKRTKKI